METTLGNLVSTADGSLTLCHPEHGECYHSEAGAQAEARALYLEASGFDASLRPGAPALSVLDIGLGLGYNAITTLTAWLAAAAAPQLHLESLEINAELVKALVSGTAPWQSNWTPAARAFCTQMQCVTAEHWHGEFPHPTSGEFATWDIYLGDAATAPFFAGDNAGKKHSVQYIWQDPFSPKKNPPLWSTLWFLQLAGVAAPGCILMTYSVAGGVRRALVDAGWDIVKIPAGLPGKRHWLKASLRPPMPGAFSTT